jgi:hypothetical protein
MQSSTRSLFRLAVCAVVALQISCGGDSSGPGNIATSMSANSSISLNSPPGSAVTERPSVVVYDQTGNPMGGVTVTFTGTGGGTVTGGSQVTNAQGVATVGGWTLGATVGSYTLVASAANVAPVTFTASTVDPCTTLTPFTFGTSANANLATSDCQLGDGSFIDFFSTTVPAAGTYLFTQTASNIDSFLVLFGSTGVVIGVNDDISVDTRNSAVKAILPAGDYRLGATSWAANEVGAYTLTSAASGTGITNCEDVFLTRGSNTAQQLQTTDCVLPNTAVGDDYFVFIEAGQSITVTMASSAFNTNLELWSTPTTRVAFNDDDGTSTDSRMTFTSTISNLYLVRATSSAPGASGAYTLAVE